MKLPENLYSMLMAPISIHPNAVEAILAEIMSRNKSGEQAVMPVCALHSAKGGTSKVSTDKKVMVIPVMKFISKYDIEQYGILGTKTIQSIIKGCIADDNIAGIVLHINNPGGTVMNTKETAEDIFASPKPIVTFGEDGVFSSAFYLAAASDYIIASGPTTGVGNIGTKSQGIDFNGIFTKLGAKSWEIFATESYDKDLGFNAALDGKPEKFQGMILDPYNKMFMDDMKMMRPQIHADALHGATYVAQTAIEMGLIDAIGTMEDAVAKVMELSNSNSQSNSNNNMKKVTMSIPEAMLGAVKALGGIEVTATGDNADATTALEALKGSTATEIESLQGKITALTTDKTTAEGKVTTLEASITDLTDKVTALTSDKTTLSAEIVALKGSTPGALRSAGRQAVVEGQDKEPEGSGDLIEVDAKVQSAIDAVDAHFKENFSYLD